MQSYSQLSRRHMRENTVCGNGHSSPCRGHGGTPLLQRQGFPAPLVSLHPASLPELFHTPRPLSLQAPFSSAPVPNIWPRRLGEEKEMPLNLNVTTNKRTGQTCLHSPHLHTPLPVPHEEQFRAQQGNIPDLLAHVQKARKPWLTVSAFTVEASHRPESRLTRSTAQI